MYWQPGPLAPRATAHGDRHRRAASEIRLDGVDRRAAHRTAPPSLGILTRPPLFVRTLLDSNIPVRERGIQIDHYPCCAQYRVPRTDGLVVVIGCEEQHDAVLLKKWH